MKNREPKTKSKQYLPLVYICSKYSGDVDKNVVDARTYSRFAVDEGMIALAPHLLLPQYMSDETQRELAMKMYLVFLDKCDELWVFGSEISKGMAFEIERARRHRKKIRYFDSSCKEIKSVQDLKPKGRKDS